MSKIKDDTNNDGIVRIPVQVGEIREGSNKEFDKTNEEQKLPEPIAPEETAQENDNEAGNDSGEGGDGGNVS